MRLLDRLLGRKSITSDPDVVRILMGGVETASGEAVTRESALRIVTVLACVRVLAEGVAQVPWKLYRRGPSGTREEARDHPLYRLLHTAPNGWQSSFDFRATLVLHRALTGNAFVFVNRAGAGRNRRIVELVPIKPERVTIEPGNGMEPPRYLVRSAGDAQIELPPDAIWHLRGLSWDGVAGLDAIRQAREALGLNMAMERHSANTFARGAAISGLLTTEKGLTDAQVKDLRAAWQADYGGARRAGSVAVLFGGLRFEKLAQTSVEAQLLEGRRFQIEEICRLFRVAPMLVGAPDKTATYASAEQFFLHHVVHTLGPWYTAIEQSADMTLLDAEREPELYTKFIDAGLLRGAAADRASFYGAALNDGWMTANEVRGREELNPLPGGDVLRSPLNMARADGVQDQPDEPTAPSREEDE
ncbi:phage portal protein [Elioraea sp.]|uniref:phage portal protein n=1 Tax=Elioraea sp. TaxID=2185103 RepID=UPI0025C6AFDE|nr:phage portal protein [Elioraea sp.]